MGAILSVATILAGLAAGVYIWDWWKQRGIPKQPLMTARSEKLVDFNYPRDSGLEARLLAQGYKVSWSDRSKLARRIDLEGWEYVADETPEGKKLTTNRGDLVYIKKKRDKAKTVPEEVGLA